MALVCLWLSPPLLSQSLSLVDAISQAVNTHPQVIAAQKRLDAARIRARYAGAVLNPTARIGEAVGDAVEELINLSQRFELAGQPGLRSELAGQQVRVRACEAIIARRDVAVLAGRFYVQLWLAEQRQQTFTQRQALYLELERVAKRRYEVGEISENQYARVALERQRADADLAGVVAESSQAEARLRTSLGRAQTIQLPVSGLDVPEAPIPPGEFPSTLEQLRAVSDGMPEVGQAQANLEASRLQTELARKEGSPELGFSLYRSTFVQQNVQQGFQVSLSWVPWDYGMIAAEVATREGEQQALQAEVDLARRNASQRLENTFLGLQGARRRRDILRTQVREALRLARLAQKGLETGYWTLQEALDAQRSYRDSQLEYLNAESEYSLARLELIWVTRTLTNSAPATKEEETHP